MSMALMGNRDTNAWRGWGARQGVTGVPVEIERHGKILKIVLEEPPGKLANLRPRPCLLEVPEGLVHLDGSGEGRP